MVSYLSLIHISTIKDGKLTPENEGKLVVVSGTLKPAEQLQDCLLYTSSLLPVCMLNIKYMNNTYKVAVNGQTGKVLGEYPIDNRKKWRYFAKIAGFA